MQSLTALVLCTTILLRQDTQEYKIALQAKDGTSLTGTARFPAATTVKTKFGDVQVDTATIIEINRQGPQFAFRLTTGNIIVGTWSPGKIDLETSGGKLSIGEEDLRSIGFPGRSPLPATGAATPVPVAPPAPKKEPRFKGFDYRKEYARELATYKTYEPALLLPGGGHLALLDPRNDECVIVDLSSGGIARIKVESGPVALAEKSGKLYVANSRSNSLSIIDPRAQRGTGKVSVGASPRWLAAPVLGDFLYVLTGGGDETVLCVDVRTDKVAGPLLNSDFGRQVSARCQGLVVSPDNRVLVLTGTEGNGPSCRPDTFILSGQKATSYWLNHLHTDHSPAYVMDLVGARLYSGWLVYSLDMRERLGELPSLISVPHPTKNLIFGTKKGQTRGVPSETLLIIDEEKLTSLAEVPVGDDIRALVPTETRLYVIGPTSVYPLELAAIVPADALSKPKARRFPDLVKTVADADIKKAQALIAEGQRLVDGGKLDDAGSKFDQAYVLDPLSGAKSGQGQVLLRKKSLPEAIELLKAAVNHPFRNPATRFEVYAYLGIAYGQSNQHEAAVRTFQEGLRFEPKDVLLLKNLGIAHGNAGNLGLAYVAWSRCLLADPKQADARKLLDEATKRLIASTTAKCGSCNGDGKFETVIQEQGAAKRKVMSDCKTCKASGKTWKRPCVDCQATGRKFPDDFCEKCYGRGSVPEPSK